jgi:predicted nucleic-acid-binding Zn-ribbon protein
MSNILLDVYNQRHCIKCDSYNGQEMRRSLDNRYIIYRCPNCGYSWMFRTY